MLRLGAQGAGDACVHWTLNRIGISLSVIEKEHERTAFVLFGNGYC